MGNRRKILILVFLLSLVLRLSLIYLAYHGDLNNNISWGTIAYEGGLRGFYEGETLASVELVSEGWPYSEPNQPPMTILMFAALRFIWQLVEDVSWWLNNNFAIFPSPFIWFWEQKGMVFLIKLPSILADLAIGWLIYGYIVQYSKFKIQNGKRAILFTAVWLFNPVTWYNSAVWGQTDSVVNLLGLIAIFALVNRSLVKFAIFMALSLLFKGSLVIFVPILAYIAWLQKHEIAKWLRATLFVLFTTIFVAFWFHPKPDLLFWLFRLYKERILPGEIGYLTANAFNLWWLVDPGKTFDFVKYLGFSARVWGFSVVLVGIFFIILWLRRKVSDKRVYFSLCLTTLLSFLFLTRIHERYLYPFFPYATILLSSFPLFSIPYTILSLTHILNLYNLFWAPSFPFLESLYDYAMFPKILSVTNILVLLLLLRLLKASKI